MSAKDEPQVSLGERMQAEWRNRHLLPTPSYVLVPEGQISWAMRDAFYKTLNAVPAFARGLGLLFDRWSERRAVLFARAWALPRRGLADLRWSHDWWRHSDGKRVVLYAGHYMSAAPDNEAESEMRPLGYRRFPPPLLSERKLAVGAERLYRRATLRWPWARIARAEDPYADDLSGRIKTVHDDVHRWAIAIGVNLPQRPPGRPRRRRTPAA